MSHQVESMAFANAVPWHGLGNRVDASVSVDEMLVAAGLNWNVIEVPCFIDFAGKRKKVDRKAIVRETDGKVFSITGDNWKPVQNREVMEFFRSYTEEGGATLETAGSLKDGKVIWGLAQIKGGFELNGRDAVKAYILMTSSHEIGNATHVRSTPIRVVCVNTMRAALGNNVEHYRQDHRKAFDISKARETVQLAQEGMGKLQMEAKALQQLKMSEFDTVRTFARHFQPKPVDVVHEDEFVQAMIDDPEKQNLHMKQLEWANLKAPGATPGTGWGVYNAVTYWTDHIAGSNNSSRMFNSWLGKRGQVKEDVKKELLEMAV